MTRSLLILFLIDTLGLMLGGPGESVKTGLQTIVATLREDSYASELLHMGVLPFDRHVRKGLKERAENGVTVNTLDARGFERFCPDGDWWSGIE